MDTCLSQNTELIYVLHYSLLISVMPTIRIKTFRCIFFNPELENVPQPFFFSLYFSVAEESYSFERSSLNEQM